MGATPRSLQPAEKRLAGRGLVGDNVIMTAAEQPNEQTLRVTQSQSEESVSLPRSVLERLSLRDGDQVQLHQTEAGVSIRVVSEQDAEQLEIARQVMARRHDALKKLAE